jgi:hypothetical protein
MRKFTPFATGSAQLLLGVLADHTTPEDRYRQAMIELGRQLAVDVERLVPNIKDVAVCVACTAEDADFLARGLIEGLEGVGVDSSRLKLVCFWNERVRRFNGADKDSFDVAPIVKQYREDMTLADAALVVVKSIISGACVVKTNLATLIDSEMPQRIIVAAPVMRKGAEERLASDFAPSTAQRFEYLTFAIDDEKGQDDNVIPGIGGSVYERLGIDNKLSYVPEIVKQRRQKLAHV